ncbi:acyltransferase family protein [Bailinhaonella thermotolerans]|uniref:Acyltransferase n=1 Tax=Bailinhaonella thermotolerans TaxID=1070861 RepID=A0A3A4APS4_9ACTN|nr:acyltransferase [Bailinhaonella thermotolerans]RJL31676.1 acyltransferase [Bailinhaonella thermotolerans]
MTGPRPAAPSRSGGGARRGVREVLGGIAEATPAGRDRGVDALRAAAILGVVLGHWLVSAFRPAAGGGHLTDSPLAHMPELSPVSWALQTLAVFFFVGGYVATRGVRGVRAAVPYRDWVAARWSRLTRPVVPLLAAWGALLAAMAYAGVPATTMRAMAMTGLGPLWFVAVYVLVTVCTPMLIRAPRGVVAASMAGVVLVSDVARFGAGGPAWAGAVNVVAGWLVPYALGSDLARGGLGGRRAAWGLFLGGAAVTGALITWFGYPASMVGVTGARVSNLDPPSLAAVAFGSAQAGLALLLREPLARLMRRPRLWGAVALANLAAMPVFLWHQSVLVLAVLVTLPGAPLPGLHAAPDSPDWIAARLALLPVFALGLAAVAAVSLRRTARPFL